MLNRATQITYAPGSTFKPFVALAAVKEGFASLAGYDCPAEYVHPGDESGHVPATGRDGRRRAVDRDGLRLSCDTQYYAWGSQFYNRDLGTGQEAPAPRPTMGIRAPERVDLPAEAAGTVPDRRYVGRHQDVYPDGWIRGSTSSSRSARGDEGDAAAGGAGVLGARQRQALPAAPRRQDRGQGGRRREEVGGRCRGSILEGGSSTTSGRRWRASRPAARRPRSSRSATSTSPEDGDGRAPPFQDTSWFAGIVPARTRSTSWWRRSTGWIRGGDGRPDRAEHHEPDLPNPMSRARPRGGGGLMDLVAGASLRGRAPSDPSHRRRTARGHRDDARDRVLPPVLGDEPDPPAGSSRPVPASEQAGRDRRDRGGSAPGDGDVRLSLPEGLRGVHLRGDDRPCCSCGCRSSARRRPARSVVRGRGVPGHAVGVREDRPDRDARREPVRIRHAPATVQDVVRLCDGPRAARPRVHPAGHRHLDGRDALAGMFLVAG